MSTTIVWTSLTGLAATAEPAARALTPMGWIFLGVSMLFVWGLAGWCYYRVMTAPGEIEKPPDMLGG